MFPVPTPLLCVTLSLHSIGFLEVAPISCGDQKSVTGTKSKECVHIKKSNKDFPGGLVVKNPPSNAGDAGSIPGWGTRIPHATGQLS